MQRVDFEVKKEADAAKREMGGFAECFKKGHSLDGIKEFGNIKDMVNILNGEEIDKKERKPIDKKETKPIDEIDEKETKPIFICFIDEMLNWCQRGMISREHCIGGIRNLKKIYNTLINTAILKYLGALDSETFLQAQGDVDRDWRYLEDAFINDRKCTDLEVVPSAGKLMLVIEASKKYAGFKPVEKPEGKDKYSDSRPMVIQPSAGKAHGNGGRNHY